jgi:adenosine deaminase
LKRHPRLKSWIENRYPISINTDDPGIFNTNSTLELVLLAEAFDLKNPDIIVKIIENSIEHIFESSAFKQQFKKNISHRVQSLMKEYYGKNLN